MKFVVFGAGGVVGGLVARELIARGHRVRIPRPDPGRGRSFGPSGEIVRADLLDPYTLAGIYDGIDGVFLASSVSQTEASEALTAVLAARKTGVRRIAYLSMQHVDRAPYLPHFGAKLAVEAALQASGVAWTILRPSNFFQNDLAHREELLLEGVYPQPLGGVGVSRVDARDVAELAALALTQPGHEGRIHDVVGPQALTGTQMAEMWSRALGRRITYAGDDLDAWERRALARMPGWWVFDMRNMYRHLQSKGLRASEQEVVKTAAALGHPPRSIEPFAAEAAREWSKEAAAASRT